MAVTLYTCRANLDDGSIHRAAPEQFEDYPVYESEEVAEWCGGAGYATYEDDSVYAESIVSQADADRLVAEKCREMVDKLTAVLADLH